MSTPVGVLAKFASACSVDSPTFPFPPKAPSMPCSIGMVWSSGAVACVIGRTAHPYRWASDPMSSGVPITKASSYWARQYCYPLTVTDHASRFLLTCEALSSTRQDYAFTVFERLFKELGLPANIRSDNGVPFATAHALF